LQPDRLKPDRLPGGEFIRAPALREGECTKDFPVHADDWLKDDISERKNPRAGAQSFRGDADNPSETRIKQRDSALFE